MKVSDIPEEQLTAVCRALWPILVEHRSKDYNEKLMADIKEARRLINDACVMMTPDQIGQWRGVRTWLEGAEL